MAKRTTHRSLKGTKLYAVRNADGQFEDIQTYKRAHAADLRKKSADEMASATKKKSTAKKSTRKAAKKSTKKAVKRTKKAARR